MSDGALDLVVLLLCLAILTPIGINVIVPLVSEVEISMSQEMGDKTVPEIKGINPLAEYDGGLDIFEVVLTTQVQDYTMPYPRLLSIPSNSCPSIDYHYYTRAEARNLDDAPSNAGCFNGSSYTCQDSLILSITSMYRPDIKAYGAEVYKALRNEYVHDTYEIIYEFGRHGLQDNMPVESLDSYRIIEKE